jgi:hypothetical protein
MWRFIGTVFAVGAFLVVAILAVVDPRPDHLEILLTAPLLVLLTIPIALRLARADGDPAIVTLVLVALTLKLVGSVVRYYVGVNAYGGSGDSVDYYDAARVLGPAFRSLDFNVTTGRIPGTGFIELVTGVLYALTGASRLVGFMVFSWFCLLGQILCWRAFRIGVPHGDSKRYAFLVLLFPSMLFWPSSVGKEAWMIFAIGITVYGVARMVRHLRWGVPLTVVGVAAATLARPHVALLLLAGVFAALLVTRPPERSATAPLARLLWIAVVIVALVVVLNETQSLLGVENLDQESVQATLASTEVRTAQGASAFEPVVVNSPLDVPLATVTVLFRPLPFEVGNAQMLLTSAEGLLLAALVVMSWRRLASIPRLMWSTPYVMFALVFVVLFVCTFSSFANFGILARQRTQMLPFLFVLLAVPPVRQRLGQVRSSSSHREDAAVERAG